MSCYDPGALQAYLDGELEPQAGAELQRHLATCRRCWEELESLREHAGFVNDRLALLRIEVDRQDVDPAQAWPGFLKRLDQEQKIEQVQIPSVKWGRLPLPAEPGDVAERPGGMKGWISMPGRYRRVAVAAAAAVALIVAFSFEPVQGAASQFLAIFRVERIQTLTISPGDIQSITKALEKGDAKVDLREFGQVQIEGRQSVDTVTFGEAAAAVDFPLLVPEALPEGFVTEPEVRLHSGASVSFTFNVKNINSALKSFGARTLLPDSIDGKTVTLRVPPQVAMVYPGSREGTGLAMFQGRSPELEVPPGIDAEGVRQVMLDLPLVPENLRRQLAAIKDWQHTLVIPVPEGAGAEVEVAGTRGVFFSEGGHGARTLIWQRDGVIRAISGNLTADQAISLAENLVKK